MNRIRVLVSFLAFPLAVLMGAGVFLLLRGDNAAAMQDSKTDRITSGRRPYPKFEMEVLVNGRPVAEYYARGRTYVEALQGAEYELRLRNPSPDRVAVALSVDGLNTIDARHTSAWNASKWVIEPYQTITISGWQMSSERARRFYFTDERDSYGAKLGQTANLGVISAVFYREIQRVRPVTQGTPTYRDERQSSAPKSKAAGEAARDNRAIMPTPDGDYAATGIGRSVKHDVRWVNMELDSRSAAEMTIRYEFYPALVRLGIVPKRSREDARGFSPKP
jgi:hypothetical protein